MIFKQNCFFPLFLANNQETSKLTVTRPINRINSNLNSQTTNAGSTTISHSQDFISSNQETDRFNNNLPNRTSMLIDDLETMIKSLDKHLQPVPPIQKNQQSQQIFEEHKELAKDYLKVSKHEMFFANFDII